MADLLEHKEPIHGLILHQEASDGGGGGGGASAWLSAFWAFVSQHPEVGDPRPAGVFHDRSSLARLFADWSVLQVEDHADPQQVRTVALSSAGAAFNVHEVDKDWQAEGRSLLQACGVHVPCRWHVEAADAPLRRFVLEGDLALVGLLAAAMERVDFNAPMRQAAPRHPNPNPNPNPYPKPKPKPKPNPNPNPDPDPDPNSHPSPSPDPKQTTLRYFASRKQNSSDVLCTLRKMPLFLRSRPSQSDRHVQSSGQPSTANPNPHLYPHPHPHSHPHPNPKQASPARRLSTCVSTSQAWSTSRCGRRTTSSSGTRASCSCSSSRGCASSRTAVTLALALSLTLALNLTPALTLTLALTLALPLTLTLTLTLTPTLTR